MAESRDYRAEAASLARAENHQLRALLLAFDVIDKSLQSANAVLEPLRRPKAQEEADRA